MFMCKKVFIDNFVFVNMSSFSVTTSITEEFTFVLVLA